MIEAIFLDFDWTLYSHKNEMIPDSAYKAIKDAQSKNVKVFLSTGRDIEEIKTFDCRDLQFDGYVLDNGQLLMDKNLNIIEANYIEGKGKEAVLDIFNNKIYPIVLRGINCAFINYVDEYVLKAYKDVGSDLPEIKKYENEDILVATIGVKDEKEKENISNMLSDLSVTWWHDNSCDAVSKGSDKVVGVNKIIKYFNINKDNVLSIGDGENDIGMIKNTAHSVAMGNSIQEVKDVAEYVTSDIDDDGLLNAFKKYNIV